MAVSNRTEDYLKYIYVLSQTQKVHSAKLAEALGISAPTVCIALQNLQHDGYLTMNSKREIILTDCGRQIAQKVYEKHIAMEQMLCHLGVSQEEAHKDACYLEHSISPKSFSALKKVVLK